MKGGIFVSEVNNGLRFDIYERVHLPENVAAIDELEEIELVPRIQVIDQGEQAVLQGQLVLNGIYRAQGTEDEQVALEHWIPVEISLPMNRVTRLDDITVDIDTFDVVLLSSRALNITGVLSLRGIVLEQEEDENAWDQDSFVATHERSEEDEQLQLQDDDQYEYRYEETQEEDQEIEEEQDEEVYTSILQSDESESEEEIEQSLEQREEDQFISEHDDSEQEQESDEEQINYVYQNAEEEEQINYVYQNAEEEVVQAPQYRTEEKSFIHFEDQVDVEPQEELNTTGQQWENDDIAREADIEVSVVEQAEQEQSERDIESIDTDAIEVADEDVEVAEATTFTQDHEVQIALNGNKNHNETLGIRTILNSSLREQAAHQASLLQQEQERERQEEEAKKQVVEEEIEWKQMFLSKRSEQSEFKRIRMCIVQKEDTLEEIALRYNINARDLLTANKLHESAISEGQLLYIP